MGASVRQRKDRGGAWTIYFRRGSKRWAESVGNTPEDEAAAREAAARFNAEEHAAREHRSALRAGNPAAFNALAEAWWESLSPALPASSRGAKRPVVYERLIPHFGALDVRRLDEDAARACAVRFAELGHARETVETTGSILDSILAWAVRRQLVERCPLLRVCGGPGARSAFRKVAAARCPPPARVEAWTREEVAEILACAKERGDWVHDPILFAAQTGCRRGEILALEWADVDLERGRALIRQSLSCGQVKTTKADKIRYVDLAPDAIRMLQRRFEENRTGRVFRGKRGRNWTDRGFNTMWQRVRASAVKRGVRKGKMHNFRHSWASWALAAGLDTMWVASQIGDTIDVLLSRYAHIVDSGPRSLSFLSLPSAPRKPSDKQN